MQEVSGSIPLGSTKHLRSKVPRQSLRRSDESANPPYSKSDNASSSCIRCVAINSRGSSPSRAQAMAGACGWFPGPGGYFNRSKSPAGSGSTRHHQDHQSHLAKQHRINTVHHLAAQPNAQHHRQNQQRREGQVCAFRTPSRYARREAPPRPARRSPLDPHLIMFRGPERV